MILIEHVKHFWENSPTSLGTLLTSFLYSFGTRSSNNMHIPLTIHAWNLVGLIIKNSIGSKILGNVNISRRSILSNSHMLSIIMTNIRSLRTGKELCSQPGGSHFWTLASNLLIFPLIIKIHWIITIRNGLSIYRTSTFLPRSPAFCNTGKNSASRLVRIKKRSSTNL